MISYYRNLSLSTRLLALGLVEAIVVAICLRNLTPLVALGAAGGVAGLALLFDSLLRRFRMMLSVFVVLLQLAVVYVSAIQIDQGTNTAAGYTSTTWYILTLYVFMNWFFLTIQVALSVFVARGRVWFNILASSAILNIVYVLVAGFLKVLPYPIFTSPLIAFGVVLIYFALRSISFKKKSFELPARSTNIEKKTAEWFTSSGYTIIPVEDKVRYPYLDFVAYNEKIIYPVYTVDTKKRLDIFKNELINDGIPITPIFEHLIEASKKFLRLRGIRSPRIQPVLFSRKSGLNPAFRSIGIRSRKTPDRKLGSVFISNQDGFKTARKAEKPLSPLSNRIIKKLNKASGFSVLSEATAPVPAAVAE